MELVPALTFAGIALLVGGLSWLARRTDRRDAAHPGRVRMPRLVLWVGVGGLALTLAVLLAASGSGVSAATVVPLVLLAVFGFLILLHANWYLVVEPDRLTFRNALGLGLGLVRTIRYEEITRARVPRRYGATQLTIRSSRGTRFSIDPGTFDVGPLLTWLGTRGWDLSAR